LAGPGLQGLRPGTGRSSLSRRAGGAPLYHRNSQFCPPERCLLEGNTRVRIFHLAATLDHRTRRTWQHGSILKRIGIEVLRVLLFKFLNMKTGACFPSYQQIAEAAGCCIETMRKAIRAPEAAGIITTIRRKIVATFTSRQHRA
jgi:helix-turn-helix protein